MGADLKVVHVFGQIDEGERHALLGMKGQGVTTVVACDPAANFQRDLADAGIPVHHIAVRRRRDRDAIAAVRRLVTAESPDVVHCYTKRVLSNAVVALRDLPVRLVAYRGIIGNLHWLDPSSRGSFFHPRVDRIICVCEAVRQSLLGNRFLGWRLAPEKAVTVYKGHHVDWWQRPGTPVDLGEFGVPPGVPVVGCVARMRRRKGIPSLVTAFEKLADQRAHLVLVGEVVDRQVPRRIARSPVRDRIHLTGWQSDAARLAGAFDVFVLPTLRREGLPRAVIEAMCQNVPPVVTASGGSPELVEDGISGRIVPPGDTAALAVALEGLLDNRDRRTAMGRAAAEHIRKTFSPERTVRETLTVYRELLDQA